MIAAMKEVSRVHAQEHPFAQYVRILGKGKKGARSLTYDEAFVAMKKILLGEVRPEQLGAFLMLLRVKEESAEEIAGFVCASREVIAAPSIRADIDWSSYAGKRKHQPWFLFTSLLLAENGYRVFMHGTDGHTNGRIYTESVLEFLGLPIAKNWSEVEKQLDAANLAFMPLRHFCPRLNDIIELRNVLGLRSPVHTFARMLNPLGARYSFQSIFHPPYAFTHLNASRLLQQPNMAVFKGEGGEIERKPDATCIVRGIRNGVEFEEEWPRILEGRQDAPEDFDISLMQKVWRGEHTDQYAVTAICSTLAVILKSLEVVNSQSDALATAMQWWEKRNKKRI